MVTASLVIAEPTSPVVARPKSPVMAGPDPIGIRIAEQPRKILPLPLREGGGGRGWCLHRSDFPCASTPPPGPLPQGEGESEMSF
jgi:hypothetical protein